MEKDGAALEGEGIQSGLDDSEWRLMILCSRELLQTQREKKSCKRERRVVYVFFMLYGWPETMGNICLICCFLTRLGLTVTFHWSHCVSSQIHRQVFSTPSITRWSWGAWIHKVSTLQEAINSSIQCCGVLHTNRFLHHVVGPRRKAKCLYLFWTIKSGELSQVVMKTNTQIPKEREHGVKMTQVNIVFYNHVFHKVVKLVPSLLVNGRALPGCSFPTQSWYCHLLLMNLWKVSNRCFSLLLPASKLVWIVSLPSRSDWLIRENIR